MVTARHGITFFTIRIEFRLLQQMLKQKIRCWMEGYKNERASYYISILGSQKQEAEKKY